MAKTKLILEEGVVFSIKLSENAWTLGQLCNLFKLEGKSYEQYTLAFFNYLFSSEEELKNNIEVIDLSEPIIILTINGHPVRTYKLNVVGKCIFRFKLTPLFRNILTPLFRRY